MQILAALFAVTVVAAAPAHASSIVELGGNTSGPSIVMSGDAGRSASVIERGTPTVDTGKVAAIARAPARMGPAPLVIRGGEVGSSSPRPPAVATAPAAPAAPAAGAPAQPTASAAPAPEPAKADSVTVDPAYPETE
ncbi:hypothetical protein PV773_01710 [Mesorhizobium sp. CC13]|uniref:hypothetical protein n=1 Tax=Mesorhizobium sp. CC13 TaxID=3029194 RepID=UPI003267EA80